MKSSVAAVEARALLRSERRQRGQEPVLLAPASVGRSAAGAVVGNVAADRAALERQRAGVVDAPPAYLPGSWERRWRGSSGLATRARHHRPPTLQAVTEPASAALSI